MHYILGTTFNVSAQMRGVTDKGTLEKNRYSRYFPVPGSYEVYYIRKTRDGMMEYTFYNRSTGDKTVHEFKSTSDADKILSVMIGEHLPDYTKNYEEMSD